MKLPTVQAAERRITIVGAALRSCLRPLTATLMLCFTWLLFLLLGGVGLLPKPLSQHAPYSLHRYPMIEASAEIAFSFAVVALLVCIVAALTTLDARRRAERPLLWHVATALLVLFATVFTLAVRID